MIDLTPLLLATITVLAAILTQKAAKWLKARTDAEDRAELLEWVRLAVAAAEQLYNSNQGEEKKQAVIDFLRDRGFTIEYNQLNTAVEAAVLELHHALKDG